MKTWNRMPLHARHHGFKPLRSLYRRGSTVSGMVVLMLFSGVRPVPAHEPIFGLGRHVIFQGGLGVELEWEYEFATSDLNRERASALHTEMLYGITEDLAVTLVLPTILAHSERTPLEEETASGIGDVSARVKYRFWRRDHPGIQDSAAILVGVKFPTGSENTEPALGSGSTDFLLGFAAARESRRWYHFGDVRMRLNTANPQGFRKGHRLFIDAAFGVRPWTLNYRDPDLVLLMEVNWETHWADAVRGQARDETRKDLFFLAPGFFFTYRNWALKGGVQIPVYQNTKKPGLRASTRPARAGPCRFRTARSWKPCNPNMNSEGKKHDGDTGCDAAPQ